MKRTLFLSMMATVGLLLPEMALAQGYDDLDEGAAGGEKQTSSRRQREVREVVKGIYAKSNVGGASYLLDFRGWVRNGTAVGLTVGMDFMDRETTSFSGELSFIQGVHNGVDYITQGDYGCQLAGGAAPCVQGDLRTYTFQGVVKGSFYPVRRVGLGARLGVGVLRSPLLMDELAYSTQVLVTEWNLPADPGYHDSFKPLALIGLTAEYYSKLSHFSIGADVDLFYALNFDLGLNWTGYFKYTF
jgi:hypothetical protein